MSAAVGAWFARPASKCVAIMGDGSFGFSVGELETVVRHKVPLLMLVFSNAAFGWIKASQKASYGGRYFSVDFSRTDHALIASGYGVKSWRVDDPDAARRRAARGASSTTGRRSSTSSCSRSKTPRRPSCSGWGERRPAGGRGVFRPFGAGRVGLVKVGGRPTL